MSTTPAQSQIGEYLDRVRVALADLPPDARDELLDDLPDHLAEVLAEDTGTLTERLGEPEQYAAELRAVAGVGAAAAPAGPERRWRPQQWLRGAAERADARVGPALGYRRVSDLLAQLRPGWWLLRGYLAGLLLYAAIFGSPPAVPPLRPAGLVWLLLVLAGMVASVRLGQVNLRPAGRLVLGVATVFLLVFGAAALNLGRERFEPTAGSVDIDRYESTDRYGGVVDVYPYDANGHPLSGVTLYDQNGVPILLGDPFRCLDPLEKPRIADRSALTKVGPAFGRGYPLCPPTGWAPSSPAGPQPSPSASPPPSPQPIPQPSPNR
jgi:hypothetical protein